jgi:hypothetical protein
MTKSIFPIKRCNLSIYYFLLTAILLISYSSNGISGQTMEKIIPKSFTVENSSTVVSPDFDLKITKTFQTNSDSHFTQPILYNNSEGSSEVVPFAVSNSTITITSDVLEGDSDIIKLNHTILDSSNN